MKTPAQVLGLTIAELGLPETTTFYLIKKVHPEASYRNRHALAKGKTLMAVLDAWGPYRRPRHSERERSLHARRFKKKLAQLGLSRLEWTHLPQKTVTLKKQKALPKEVWLDLPVYLLGTLSSGALDYVTNDDQCLTVREFLALPKEPGSYFASDFFKRCKASVQKTRKLLHALGFTYEDGPFMQEGTKRKSVETLMARHNISKRTASMIFAIAKTEGWIPKRVV